MPTITAAVAREQGKPLTLEQVEQDDLGPDEARVRMVATGICHTDVVTGLSLAPGPRVPFENAGSSILANPRPDMTMVP